MKQSILPERLEPSNTIAKMTTGQEGYTLPWAIWVDQDRSMWIHPDYPTFPYAQGTATLSIRREADGVTVFERSITDPQYKPSTNPGFVSPRDTEYLPVQLA